MGKQAPKLSKKTFLDRFGKFPFSGFRHSHKRAPRMKISLQDRGCDVSTRETVAAIVASGY